MDPNEEALVLLLDVGDGVLQEVKNILVPKLVYNRSDEVGIVLFGTKENCDKLAKELEDYEHVTVAVVHDIKVVDEGTSQVLQNLPVGSVHGDFLPALVVSWNMVIGKCGNTKGKRRLCLITCAQYPLRDPPEGTKDKVARITNMMKTHDIKMECIVFREPGVHHNSVMEENHCLLNQFRNRSGAKVVQVDSPTSLLGALKTRNVLPRTVFKGDLEVSPDFKIKVWVYKKTAEEKFPTLNKCPYNAPPSDELASHDVKMDYKCELNKVVQPDQRTKGCLSDPQVAPLSSAKREAVKFKPRDVVKLLGFTDRSSISRHHFMKDVCLFVPKPGNKEAALAVSAIARAMGQMNKVAIVQCVWRHDQGNVALGVLTPNISSENNVQDSFYFNVLPFAKDIGKFQFPSFSRLPSFSQPTEEQQKAADNFVSMLNLAPSGREVLKPEFTPNPMLERFYSYLDLKAKQPDANVPPLETCLMRITEPDRDDIDERTLVSIENLDKAFELKENPKKKKARTQDAGVY